MSGASNSVSEIENISLTNGNLSLSIPLASLPPIAGGKLKLTVSAVYNSKLWNMTREQLDDSSDLAWQPYTVSTPQLSDLGGWTIAGSYRIYIRAVQEDFNYLQNAPESSGIPYWDRQLMQQPWYKVVLQGPDGSERELRPTGYSPSIGTQDFLRGYFSISPTRQQSSTTLSMAVI